MRRAIVIGILLSGAAGARVFAQSNADDIVQLTQRVAALEKQVQELSRIVEPLKAQQAADTRRKGFREKFDKKMADDRAKYSTEQLREAESLYQVANQKWGTPEANESLQNLIKKYPDINRTGCALLYVAQKSEGDARMKYLEDCIQKFADCFYGDGVQVGAYARFLLAHDYQSRGDSVKADALFAELKTAYPEAIDHSGRLLADSLKADQK
jgi:hypothetical protein